MRSFNYLWVLLVLICAFVFSGTSYAATIYYWSGPTGGGQQPSALAACEASGPYWAESSGSTYVSAYISGSAVDWRYCMVKYVKNGSTGETLIGNAIRYGDSCPPDHTYNSSTGSCDAPFLLDGTWCDRDTTPSVKGIVSGGVCVATHEAALADK